MTLEELRNKNPEIPVYGIDDEAFAEYGCRINGLDVTGLLAAGKEIPFPETGSAYEPATPAFEALPVAEEIRKRCFGELPCQVGYCYGHNSFLNALEWHTGSEINVAVTDLVLILAKRSDCKDGKLDASCAKAFLLKAGDVAEIYATSLHFCPCEVEESGFGCVVALPKGTNVPLDEASADPYLFRKNKWLIAHVENEGLIAKGVVPGITGTNYRIIH